MYKGKDLINKPIITIDEGEKIYRVDDVVFNEIAGGVEGYEVTGGTFTDVYRGKPFLPVRQVLRA